MATIANDYGALFRRFCGWVNAKKIPYEFPPRFDPTSWGEADKFLIQILLGEELGSDRKLISVAGDIVTGLLLGELNFDWMLEPHGHVLFRVKMIQYEQKTGHKPSRRKT